MIYEALFFFGKKEVVGPVVSRSISACDVFAMCFASELSSTFLAKMLRRLSLSKSRDSSRPLSEVRMFGETAVINTDEVLIAKIHSQAEAP